MTPSTWQRVEQLFEHLLALPDADRRARLTELSSTDPRLCRELEQLLAADARSNTLFDRAIAKTAQAFICAHANTPDRIGPYRILREIGSGGMGTVWLAVRDDEHFRKQVAIKLVSAGIESQPARERFLRERQILARLDHPYIARLLDGGTAGGRPYLVLDFVEGLPITRYCAGHDLSIAARVRLFRKVCEAVTYAHENLIVHRDLKPDNILVTADGTPKLLDFGVAKLLDPQWELPAMTRGPLGPMTPEYASPEQVRGEAITTAADVYSLGAILYELLAGRAPYTLTTYAPTELVDVICNRPLARPSSVASPHRIPSDLDTIVLMAMQKDPRRRYRSASQFNDDLLRYLDGLPVAARADSVAYRTRKFVERHWVGVAASAAVVFSLIAASVISRYEAHQADRMRVVAEIARGQAESERNRAEQLRRRAEQAAAEAVAQRSSAERSAQEAERHRANADRRFEQVRQLSNRFLFDFHDAIQALPGATSARRLVVKTALEFLSAMAAEASGNMALQRELASAYERIGDVQGNPFSPNLGDPSGASQSYLLAMKIRSSLPLDTPEAVRDRIALHIRLNDVYDFQGMRAQAQGELAHAVALYDRGTDHPAVLDSVSRLYIRLGDLDEKMSRSRQSLADFRRAIDILRSLHQRFPQNDVYRSQLSLAYRKLGRMLFITGDVAGAIENRKFALAEDQALSDANPTNATYRRNLMATTMNLGDNYALEQAGPFRDLDQALVYHRRALQIAEELSAADPANVQARRDVALTSSRIANVQADRRQFIEAALFMRRSLDISKALLAQSPQNHGFLEDVAYYQTLLGNAVVAVDPDSAIDVLRQGIASYQTLLKTDPKNRAILIRIAQAEDDLGEALHLKHQAVQAIVHKQRSIAMLDQLMAADPNNQEAAGMLGKIYVDVAACYQDLAAAASDPVRQLQNWQQALLWLRKSPTPDPAAKPAIEIAEKAIAALKSKQ